MATLKIYEINPAGSDLFADPESFMQDLSDRDLSNISGGFIWWTTITTTTIFIPKPTGPEQPPQKPDGGTGTPDGGASMGGYSIPDGNGGVTNVITYNGITEVIYS